MIVIPGIDISRDDKTLLCIVNDFSDELKNLIRIQLNSVWNGFAEVEDDPEIHSYGRTLGSFLDRYRTKSEETQKGMIGELLAHILVNNILIDFKSLSVLRNKEERHIKKGFDIIYHRAENDSLWYTEIKSGRSETGLDNSTTYNKVLLGRSNSGIAGMFSEGRQSLWESALIDVTLTINDKKKKIDLKKLLDGDSPYYKPSEKHNAILVSVLYHCPTDLIDYESVKEFYSKVATDGTYESVIIFSIQKKTFEKVAEFLEWEYFAHS